MNSFLDTSSLVKLYDHREPDSLSLQQQLTSQGIIYLSTLTQVEFASALARKCNRRELTTTEAITLQQQFDADADAYGWIEQTAAVRALAVQLISKHSALALRALDAIQLTSALAARASIQAFFTHDARLHAAALAEGLPVR